MMANKKKYTAPELTVVEFAVERGYASSETFIPRPGFQIEQEILMLTSVDGSGTGSQYNSSNDFNAANFSTGGGTIGRTSMNNTETGGWF